VFKMLPNEAEAVSFRTTTLAWNRVLPSRSGYINVTTPLPAYATGHYRTMASHQSLPVRAC